MKKTTALDPTRSYYSMGLDQPEKSWKSVPAKRKRVSKFGINKTGNAKISFYLKIPFVR